MQSESWPSACCVELPSKPQIGQSLAVEGSESTIFVLLRRLGSGRYPSSQTYSSLYFSPIKSHSHRKRYGEGQQLRGAAEGGHRAEMPSSSAAVRIRGRRLHLSVDEPSAVRSSDLWRAGTVPAHSALLRTLSACGSTA